MSRPKGFKHTEEAKQKMRDSQRRWRALHHPRRKTNAPISIKAFEEDKAIISQQNNGNCQICSQPLLRLKWNTQGDILICPNASCGLWHTPQGGVAIL